MGVFGCLTEDGTRVAVIEAVPRGVVTVLTGCGDVVEDGLLRPIAAILSSLLLRWPVVVESCLAVEENRAPVDAAVPLGVVATFAGSGGFLEAGLSTPFVAALALLLL